MREQRDQIIANCPDLLAEPAFELFSGGTERQIRPGANQIDHGFSLCQIHLSIEKRALGEFARTRCSSAYAQASLKNFRRNQSSAVATDLDQIFASVTRGRAMNRKHYLIDQLIFCAENLAEVLNVRCKLCGLFFAAENLVCHLDSICTGDTNQRDCAFTRRSRDGGDCIGNGHVLAGTSLPAERASSRSGVAGAPARQDDSLPAEPGKLPNLWSFAILSALQRIVDFVPSCPPK